MESSQRRRVTVAAALIIKGRSILVSQRAPGSHLEGRWEFPGGKTEPGEPPEAALRRELEEELGLATTSPVLFHREEFEYSDRHVELFYYLCRDVEGTPRPREGQRLCWVRVAELAKLETPPANRRVIGLLALSE